MYLILPMETKCVDSKMTILITNYVILFYPSISIDFNKLINFKFHARTLFMNYIEACYDQLWNVR